MKRLPLLLSVLSTYAPHAQVSRTYLEQCVTRHAAHYRIDPLLIAAFIDVESAWNPNAVSSKGAMGLMQLMPATARRFGAIDPFDPDQNIAAGTRYITVLMWEFHGEVRLVAAAYNADNKWIRSKQLNYGNPEVVAYVAAVRRRYVLRCIAAQTQHRR